MGARILLGNSTNSNLGHSGGKFGLYVSANGKDVTNCAKNELNFNTDHIGNASGAIDVGLFQNVPLISGGSEVRVVNFSTSAGASAALTTKNMGAGSIVYGTVATNFTSNTNQSGTAASSGFASATSATVVNAGLTDSDTGAVTNVSVTGSIAVIKGFSSSAALF